MSNFVDRSTIPDSLHRSAILGLIGGAISGTGVTPVPLRKRWTVADGIGENPGDRY